MLLALISRCTPQDPVCVCMCACACVYTCTCVCRRASACVCIREPETWQYSTNIFIYLSVSNACAIFFPTVLLADIVQILLL